MESNTGSSNSLYREENKTAYNFSTVARDAQMNAINQIKVLVVIFNQSNELTITNRNCIMSRKLTLINNFMQKKKLMLAIYPCIPQGHLHSSHNP